MLRVLKSLVLLLTVGSASAATITNGHLYGRHSSDGNYNIDATADMSILFNTGITSRFELDTGHEKLISEANVAKRLFYTIDNCQKVEISVGTHSNYRGTYSKAYNRLTSKYAVLPSGVYNYDYLNGDYTKTLGVGFNFTSRLSNATKFKLLFNAGDPYIRDKDALEESILGTTSNTTDLSADTARSLAATLNIDEILKFMVSKSHTYLSVSSSSAVVDDFGDFLAQNPNYQILVDKYGIQYSPLEGLELLTEYVELNIDSIGFAPSSRGLLFGTKYYYDKYFIGFTSVHSELEYYGTNTRELTATAGINGYSYGISLAYIDGEDISWDINKDGPNIASYQLFVLNWEKKIW